MPRRAGERGAIEAGALPTLLPGRPAGRRRAAPGPRSARVWGVRRLPGRARPRRRADPGRGGRRRARALVVGGVDPADLPDPAAALDALEADAVRGQPGAPGQRGDRAGRRRAAGRAGGREGRARSSTGRAAAAVRRRPRRPRRPVRPAGARRARRRAGRAPRAARRGGGPPRARPRSAPGTASGPPPAGQCRVPAGARRCWRPGEAVLATWHELLDAGRLQDGEPHLAGTPGRRWPGCPRPPRPRSASPTAARSR